MNPQAAYRKPRDPGYIGGYYWPPSIAGFAGLILTNVLATQYVAHHFEYQEALGTESFNLGSLHFYAPYKWLIWLLSFGASPDIAVKLPLLLSCVIIVAGAFASGALFFFLNLAHTKALSKNTEDLHGSAGWASKEDIEATSLLRSKPGVYVGGWYEKTAKRLHYLKHDGPEHILAFAPTRSGKGAGLVIPTLLAWPESTVVYPAFPGLFP